MSLEGGCRCGRVRYVAEGEPFNPTVCHCPDCRTVTGAPMVAWFSVRPGALRFTAPPRRYASSPGVERGFCADCGTPLTFQDRADEIDVTLCSLDDPSALPPRYHTYAAAMLPWVALADGLPRHAARRPTPEDVPSST